MSNPTAFASGKRVPRPRRGSVYRGDVGMWSWVAHRTTGVLTFFFLFAHVLDTALVRVSPEAYNKIIETYKNPLVNLFEVGLAFCGLEPSSANQETIKRVKFELYVHRMELDGSGAPGFE